MPGLDLLIPFALTVTVFAVMPGPALLYTAAQTLARGRRGGFMAALGIHAGAYVHVIAAALGLSAIFVHVPAAYWTLKLGGAMYLVWLGISIIRRETTTEAMPTVAKARPAQAFVQSMLVEILNPKAAMFFIAFLPQFVEPAASLPLWSQFLILGTITNLAFSSIDIATVFLTNHVISRLRQNNRTQKITQWIGGSVLVGLGAHLAFSEK